MILYCIVIDIYDEYIYNKILINLMEYWFIDGNVFIAVFYYSVLFILSISSYLD